VAWAALDSLVDGFHFARAAGERLRDIDVIVGVDADVNVDVDVEVEVEVGIEVGVGVVLRRCDTG
jgi:hypothetical protein